jgi:hypothetical protein
MKVEFGSDRRDDYKEKKFRKFVSSEKVAKIFFFQFSH